MYVEYIAEHIMEDVKHMNMLRVVSLSLAPTIYNCTQSHPFTHSHVENTPIS